LLFVLLGLLTFGPAACSPVLAQAGPAAIEVSEPVSVALGQLRSLVDQQKLAEAVRLIDEVLRPLPPASYDVALLSRIKATVLLNQSAYAAAAVAMETSLEVAAQKNYFTPAELQDQRYLLCQLYNQLASDAGPRDVAAQTAHLEKARLHLERWKKATPEPGADALLLETSILYHLALLKPDAADLPLLRQARAAATRGTFLHVAPKDQLYLWMITISQQLGEPEDAAGLLELLVTRHPDNAAYHEQLLGCYLNLAAATTDPETTYPHQLRAILTLERAQARGLLSDSQHRLSLARLHLGLRRFDHATRLLEQGLAAGTLENTRQTRELLVFAHLQAGAETHAIETLLQATRTFPRDGSIEASLAQLHYDAGRLPEARHHLALAVRKGNLDKPAATHVFLAYVAYELREYVAAAEWARRAETQPGVRLDDLRRLQNAIAEAAAPKSSL
jgi:tetratricopeptide (TPR) repeat protein